MEKYYLPAIFLVIGSFGLIGAIRRLKAIIGKEEPRKIIVHELLRGGSFFYAFMCFAGIYLILAPTSK